MIATLPTTHLPQPGQPPGAGLSLFRRFYSWLGLPALLGALLLAPSLAQAMVLTPLTQTGATATSATFSVTITDTNATGYWQLLQASDPPATGVTIHGSGNPTVAMTQNVPSTFTVSPLTPGVSYTLYFIATATGVDSAIESITFIAGAPAITTAPGALPTGTVGVAYSETLAADNTPASWAITGGALPPSLIIDNTGLISGTPTTAGTYNFTVTATNAEGDSVPVAFSIEVDPIAGSPVISTPPGALPAGTVGTAYNEPLAASGTPTSWAIASGALPLGLLFNTTTGDISGTPTTAGTYNFNVTATNATGTSAPVAFSIAVLPAIAPIAGAAAIPTLEPAMLAVLAAALAGLGLVLRRRRS